MNISKDLSNMKRKLKAHTELANLSYKYPFLGIKLEDHKYGQRILLFEEILKRKQVDLFDEDGVQIKVGYNSDNEIVILDVFIKTDKYPESDVLKIKSNIRSRLMNSLEIFFYRTDPNFQLSNAGLMDNMNMLNSGLELEHMSNLMDSILDHIQNIKNILKEDIRNVLKYTIKEEDH